MTRTGSARPRARGHGRTDRPSAGWWLLDELALGVSCPAWCGEDATATDDGPVCLYHAALAVENGDVDPADLTAVPAPERRENAERPR